MSKATLATVMAAFILAPGAASAQPDQAQVPPSQPDPQPDPNPQPDPIAPPTPEPAPAPDASVTATAKPTSGYKKGFFIASPDDKFALKIQGRVQARFTVESLDNGSGVDRTSENAFSLPRARLTLGGHAFSKAIKYKFQSDFGKGGVSLKDFYLDYKLGNSGPLVRVGQFKRPFSRHQLNSSSRLELVDRAITDKAFGAGRDIGVILHNNYTKSPRIEWAAGIFNGQGDKGIFSGDVVVDPTTGEGEVTGGGFSNVPAKMQPAIVARVGYNANGIKGYSEADLEGGPLRYGVGASVVTELDEDEDDSSGVRGEVDFVVKVNGLSTTGAVYFATAQDGDGFGDQSYAATGVHVQLGYMIAPHLQPAVRYALIAPDGGDNSHEITAGFSVYQFKHNFKWQTDISALVGETAGDSLVDMTARTQLQLSF